jgi:hypothetical protein
VNEERRRLLHLLAEAARELEQEIRPQLVVAGEAWVNAEWIADELEALDLELAIEALAVPA